MEYLADLERNKDGSLQIMYGIGGERNLRETTLRHLKGYEGSRPVRTGNGAYNQRQNDVLRRGARLGLPAHQAPRPCPRPPVAGALRPGGARRWRVWREPDQGIWEARGEPQHYVSSKLMCWVALDRGARLAELRGEAGLARALAGAARTRSARTSSRTASTTAACSSSTTAQRRSTPRTC